MHFSVFFCKRQRFSPYFGRVISQGMSEPDLLEASVTDGHFLLFPGLRLSMMLHVGWVSVSLRMKVGFTCLFLILIFFHIVPRSVSTGLNGR